MSLSHFAFKSRTLLHFNTFFFVYALLEGIVLTKFIIFLLNSCFSYYDRPLLLLLLLISCRVIKSSSVNIIKFYNFFDNFSWTFMNFVGYPQCLATWFHCLSLYTIILFMYMWLYGLWLIFLLIRNKLFNVMLWKMP